MKYTWWKEINILGCYNCGCLRNNWKKLGVFITERSSNYEWGLNGTPFVLNLELILIVHLFTDLFILCHSKDMNNVLMCSLTFLLWSTSVSSNLWIDVSVGIWLVIVSCYYCELFWVYTDSLRSVCLLCFLFLLCNILTIGWVMYI